MLNIHIICDLWNIKLILNDIRLYVYNIKVLFGTNDASYTMSVLYNIICYNKKIF